MTVERLRLLEVLLAEFHDEYRPRLDRPMFAGAAPWSVPVEATRIIVLNIRAREEAALRGTP